MEYQEVQTKREYLNLLNKVIEESRILAEPSPTMKIDASIYNQLTDVKKHLNDNYTFVKEEVYSR